MPADRSRQVPVTSKPWVARQAPANFGRDQILPVDWNAIAHGGVTDTNYQILPGDRVARLRLLELYNSESFAQGAECLRHGSVPKHLVMNPGRGEIARPNG